MWAYLKFELNQFFRNKKNIAIYVILLFFACYYALKIAPTYDPIEKVDKNEMEARYLTRADFLKSVEVNKPTYSLTLFAASIFPKWNEFDKERLDALKEGDLQEYAESTSKWYTYADTMTFIYGSGLLYYNPRYYTYGNDYATEDGHYGYLYSASRYEGYAQGKSNLSIDVFDEKTALQTLQRLLHSYLPLVLIISCIFFTADIVLKDRRNPTVLQGFPLSDWRKVIVKGFVAFIGSLLAILPLSVGLLIIGSRYGFGDFSLPVPKLSFVEGVFNNISMIPISMGQYLMLNLLFLAFWFLFIISLLLFLSVVIKNEFANLFVGCLVVFTEFFYFSRGIGYFWDVQWYPTSYVQIGQVISGYRNFLYGFDQLTLTNGLTILGVGTCVFLIFTFVICNHRKFKLL